MTTPIEQDSADVEDIANLQAFCYPSGDVLSKTMTFGVSYKKNIFDAWVKQPSPCCGAASIAGSINSLLRLHRSSEKAFNHMDILQVYKLLWIKKIHQKFISFERKVGFNTTEKFFTPFATIMEPLVNEAKASNNKSTASSKRKVLLSAIEKFLGTQPASSNDANVLPADVTPEGIEKEAFKSFISQLRTSLTASLSNNNANNDDKNEDDEENAGDDVLVTDNAASKAAVGGLQASSSLNNMPVENESADKDAAAVTGGGGFKNLKAAINQKRKALKKGGIAGDGDEEAGGSTNDETWIVDDLNELLKAIAGYNSLNASPYPNTAPIGNVSAIQAVEQTADLAGFGTFLKGKLFMGKRTGTSLKTSRMDVPLSTRDDEELITSQWNALKNMFSRPDSCVLFHLTNHYTIIYAIREWIIVNPSPSNPSQTDVVRQVCCARKGQRPTVWIDFTECREIMLGWDGYKMMSVQFAPTDWSQVDLNGFKKTFLEKLDEALKNHDFDSVMKVLKLYGFTSY